MGKRIQSRFEAALVLGVVTAVLAACSPEISKSFVSSDSTDAGLTMMATPTNPASYSYLSVNLFQTSCTSCHSGKNPPKGIDLSSYATIISSGAVVANNPTTSLAYQEILKGKMPPKNGPVAADLQQDLLDWINAGAPNN